MYKTQKIITTIIVIFAIIFNSFPVLATAGINSSGITILLDGENIDFDIPPFIENGHTFVPFRAIFEAFGLSVQYYEDSEQIYATLRTDKNSLKYWIDLKENTISCEGTEYDPDTLVESTVVAGKMEAKKIGTVMFQKSIELRNVSGRTFVQARVVAESLGCKVDWDESTKTVIIDSENAVIVSDQQGDLPSKVTLDRSGIAEVRAAKYKATEDELANSLNEARVRNGLPALEKDEKLTEAARLKATEMAENHVTDYPDDIKEFIEANYGQFTAYSCNYAIGIATAAEVMDKWQNSLYNLNKNVTLIGVGVAMAADGTMYWTCIRVKPFGDSEKTALEDEVLRLINAERIENGLNPVIKNNDLAKVARMKAQNNVDNSNYSHESVTYGSAEEMVEKYAKNVKFSGENLELGSGTPEKVVLVSWWNSPGHKSIMMGKDSNCAGVGVAMTDDGDYYWVLITGIH
ncbi:MAG: stalk domain-containing protein [Oscillospiraceae bacterium]|nr:stalk domain-containing protein [Oscillospiraceae bacterium]